MHAASHSAHLVTHNRLPRNSSSLAGGHCCCGAGMLLTYQNSQRHRLMHVPRSHSFGSPAVVPPLRERFAPDDWRFATPPPPARCLRTATALLLMRWAPFDTSCSGSAASPPPPLSSTGVCRGAHAGRDEDHAAHRWVMLRHWSRGMSQTSVLGCAMAQSAVSSLQPAAPAQAAAAAAHASASWLPAAAAAAPGCRPC